MRNAGSARTPAHLISTMLLLVVGLGIWIGGIVVIATEDGQGSKAPILIAFSVAAVAYSAVMLRSALSGIYYDEAGIRIVNPRQTRRIAWEDIAEFRLAPSGRHACVVWVAKTDGQLLPAEGLRGNVGWARNDTQHVQAQVDELNRRLKLKRASSRAPVDSTT